MQTNGTACSPCPRGSDCQAGASSTQRRKGNLFSKCCWETAHQLAKERSQALPLHLTQGLGMDQRLSCRKLSEHGERELHDTELGNDFMNVTLEGQETGLHHNEKFVHQMNYQQRKRQPPEWKKTFTGHTSAQGPPGSIWCLLLLPSHNTQCCLPLCLSATEPNLFS